MKINEWKVPGGEYVLVRGDGAPRWWYGDEDASQSFLHAMGVIT